MNICTSHVEIYISEVATIFICEIYENAQFIRNTRTPRTPSSVWRFVNSNPQMAKACVKYDYMQFF